MKKATSAFTQFLLFLLLIISCAGYASVIEVGENKKIKEIKAAIKASAPFDTLLIQPGEYLEHNLIVTKPLTIIGLNNPVINAENKETEIFIVQADSVIIRGLTLKNISKSYTDDFAAIKIQRSRHGRIIDNIIEGAFFAVFLKKSSEYLIKGNRINGRKNGANSEGNAIHLWECKSIEVAGNEVSGHRDGIYFEFVDNSIIHHNTSYDNDRYGLHFMFSNNDAYRYNEFRNSGAGVAVMFSYDIIMEHNLFVNNWGGSSYGLLLKEIRNGNISFNTFRSNTIGMLMEGTSKIKIESNEFIANGKAIDMKGNSLDNEIVANNFMANTFEVVTNVSHNPNIYNANYWSKYRGYDMDKDGTGDVAYRPVSVFSVIIDKIPSATILLHSFLVELLTGLERIYPYIIPEKLTDENPRMKPYSL